MNEKFTVEILNILPEIIENGPGSETINSLKSIGLNEDEVEEVLDIVNQGIGRASLYNMGMQPQQFQSYLNEDPIFLKTIDLINNSKLDYEVDTEGLHPQLKKMLNKNKEAEPVDFDAMLQDFNNPSNENRSDILYKLIDNKAPNIIEILEKALFDKKKMVQIIAIQGIEEEHLTESMKGKLFDLFVQTNDHTLISNLTKVFSNYHIKGALPFVIDKLKSSELMNVFNSILCVGEIGDKRNIVDLKPLMEIKKCPEIFDEDGMVEQTTNYTIEEITIKIIKKLEATDKD